MECGRVAGSCNTVIKKAFSPEVITSFGVNILNFLFRSVNLDCYFCTDEV